MIYQETTQIRRIVGRIDDGEECIEKLTEFCDEHDVRAATVRAVGRLSAIELVRFDSEEGDYEEIYEGEGVFDLLQLTGNVALLGDEIVIRLQALLSTDGPVAPQLLAGQLRAATAIEFEFVAEVYEDLELERGLDPDSGLLELESIRRRDSPEGPPQGDAAELEGQAMSWDDAAESADDGTEADAEEEDSEPRERDAEPEHNDETESSDPYEGVDLDTPALESGDIVDHPKLGRCRVLKIEDGTYAHIRLPQGKIRKLSLNVVEISYSGEEDGHNVFEAQVSP